MAYKDCEHSLGYLFGRLQNDPQMVGHSDIFWPWVDHTSSRDITAAAPVANVFKTETLKATVVMNSRFYLRK